MAEEVEVVGGGERLLRFTIVGVLPGIPGHGIHIIFWEREKKRWGILRRR